MNETLPVETSYKLRQVSDFNFLGNSAANKTANTSDSQHLGQHWVAWREHAQCGGNTS